MNTASFPAGPDIPSESPSTQQPRKPSPADGSWDTQWKPSVIPMTNGWEKRTRGGGWQHTLLMGGLSTVSFSDQQPHFGPDVNPNLPAAPLKWFCFSLHFLLSRRKWGLLHWERVSIPRHLQPHHIWCLLPPVEFHGPDRQELHSMDSQCPGAGPGQTQLLPVRGSGLD